MFVCVYMFFVMFWFNLKEEWLLIVDIMGGKMDFLIIVGVGIMGGIGLFGNLGKMIVMILSGGIGFFG